MAPPIGSGIAACVPSVVGSPRCGDRPSGRDRFLLDARLAQPAEGHDARCHVEQQRATTPRYGDRDRAGREARNTRAVRRHQRWTGDQRDRRTAAVGRPARVTADRAGVGGVAYARDAHAARVRALDGNSGCLHHRHRTRAAMTFEDKARRVVLDDRRFRSRVDLPRVEQFEIARQPRDAVRAHAAQIGPEQHVGHRRGVARIQPLGREQRLDESPKLFRRHALRARHLAQFVQCFGAADFIIERRRRTRVRDDGAN